MPAGNQMTILKSIAVYTGEKKQVKIAHQRTVLPSHLTPAHAWDF
jgi:hypothetical protein